MDQHAVALATHQRQHRQRGVEGARQLAWITLCAPSGDRASQRRSRTLLPALLTSTSSRPNRDAMPSTIAVMRAASVTSPGSTAASPPMRRCARRAPAAAPPGARSARPWRPLPPARGPPPRRCRCPPPSPRRSCRPDPVPCRLSSRAAAPCRMGLGPNPGEPSAARVCQATTAPRKSDADDRVPEADRPWRKDRPSGRTKAAQPRLSHRRCAAAGHRSPIPSVEIAQEEQDQDDRDRIPISQSSPPFIIVASMTP